MFIAFDVQLTSPLLAQDAKKTWQTAACQRKYHCLHDSSEKQHGLKPMLASIKIKQWALTEQLQQ